jgi:RNA polymerase-interacting CarD/CdnL/TRCF family regulator
VKKSGFLITAILVLGISIPVFSITIGLGDFYVNVGDYDYLPYNMVTAPQSAPQSINFTDVMGQYGNWTNSQQFGRVWQPYTAQGWRPYLNGHWLNTQYGPTWEGYEPWAWAGYHYGDWAYTRDAGWVWVPGYDWHPGRVSWAQGMGSIGWMPQPPNGYDYSQGYLAPAGPSNQFNYNDNDFGTAFTGNDYTYGGPYYNPQYRDAYYNPNYLQNVGNLWTFIDPSGFNSDDYADYYLGPDYSRTAFDQRAVRVTARPVSAATLQQIVRQPIPETPVEVREIQTEKKAIKVVIPASPAAVENVRKNSNRVVKEVVAPAFAEKQKEFKGQNSKQAAAINKMFRQENQPPKTQNLDNQQIVKQAQEERQAHENNRRQRAEAANQKLAKAKSERKMKEPGAPNAQMQQPNPPGRPQPTAQPRPQPNMPPPQQPGRPDMQQQNPEERARDQMAREQAREPRNQPNQPDQPNQLNQPNQPEQRRQQQMPSGNDDAQISQMIEQRISNAPALSGDNIHVQVRNGEVVLRGTVDNQQSENKALNIARSINGVRAVRSELVVKKKGNGQP